MSTVARPVTPVVSVVLVAIIQSIPMNRGEIRILQIYWLFVARGSLVGASLLAGAAMGLVTYIIYWLSKGRGAGIVGNALGAAILAIYVITFFVWGSPMVG